jgi:hypothetical protein
MSIAAIIQDLPPAPRFTGQKLAHLSSGRHENFRLDPVLMRPDGGNERSAFHGIEDLAIDLLLNGQQHPITVRRGESGEILVVYGERRWRAGIYIRTVLVSHEDQSIAEKARSFLLVCRSEPPHTKPVDRLFGQLSENSGHSFSLLEKGRVYAHIMKEDPSLTEADLARRSQTSRQAVNQALTLIRFGAPGLLRLVEQEKISPTTAGEIIGRHKYNPVAQVAAAEEAIAVAASLGKDKATPKHLPKADKPARKGIAFTLHRREKQEPTEYGIFNDPSTFSASGIPKSWHLISLELRLARYEKQWCAGFNIQAKGEGLGSPCHLLNLLDPTPANEKQAWWKVFYHATHALDQKFPEMISSLRASFRDALDAEYPDTELDTDDTAPWSEDDEDLPETSDSSPAAEDDGPELFPIGESYGDDSDDEAEADSSPVTVVDDTRPSAPDPGAMERIKSATSTNRDGTTSGPGNSGGFSAPDKQLEKIEKLLDDLDAKGIGQEDRITTTELVLRVIRNESPITDLRKHLS